MGGDFRAGNGNATVQRVHIVNDSDSCSTVHEAQTLSSSSKSGDSEPVSGSSSEKEKVPEEVKHVKKPRNHKRHKDTQKLLNLFQTSTKDDQRAGDHNSVTLEEIKQLFHKPLRKAAAKLGMSKTAFKEVCRRVGLRRWPYRMLMQADHDADSKEKRMEEERRRARRRRRRAKREKAETRQREREMDGEAGREEMGEIE